jgi:hypothetical protein
MQLLFSPFFDCCVKGESFQLIKLLCVHLDHQVQVCGQVIAELHEVNWGEFFFIFHIAYNHDNGNPHKLQKL